MKYTVNVQTAGNYTVSFRHATTIGGTALHLRDTDGTDPAGSVNCYNTGGYNLDNLTFTRN